MGDVTVVLRLLVIAVLAGLIGFERERHGRAAGLRTHLLVGVGSCLMMLTGLYLAGPAGWTSTDPSRIGAQVISGIGFLGAGTILRFRASIRGLTTAASLWAVAGIGLAVGAGFTSGAIASTIIVFVALFWLSRVEHQIRKDWYRILTVETRGSSDDLIQLRRLLSEYDVELRSFDIERAQQADTSKVELHVKLGSSHDEDNLLGEVLRLEGTRRAHWA